MAHGPTCSAARGVASTPRRRIPVAHAIVGAWDGPLVDVVDFEAIPGRGVAATVDGVRYHLGNHRLTEDRQRCSAELEGVLGAFEEDAKTTVVLMTDDARDRRDRRRRHHPRRVRAPRSRRCGGPGSTS